MPDGAVGNRQKPSDCDRGHRIRIRSSNDFYVGLVLGSAVVTTVTVGLVRNRQIYF